MGLCECNMNVLILLYHHKDQARFSVPDYVSDYVWKLKLASQSVFYIHAKIALMVFHVFSLVASRAVQWSSLNMAVWGETLGLWPFPESTPCKC